jgi:replicative DNA helicase
MIEYKINILKELESSKQNIESQKRILEQEIKKFKFSTDENIVIKINELNSILDETDLDKEERYAKFTNGVKTLVTYLEKYERTISVVEMNAKEVAHKSAQSEVSFKIYPDIFNLKPVARNGFFVCVAAPTGVGKTRWMLNLMYHKYKEKKVSYFFSFEMTNEEVLFNLLAMDLFYRSYNPNSKKHDVILSKEDMEHEYRYCTDGKRNIFRTTASRGASVGTDIGSGVCVSRTRTRCHAIFAGPAAASFSRSRVCGAGSRQ